VFLRGKPAAIDSLMQLRCRPDPGRRRDDARLRSFPVGPDGRLLHHYHGADIKPSDGIRDNPH